MKQRSAVIPLVLSIAGLFSIGLARPSHPHAIGTGGGTPRPGVELQRSAATLTPQPILGRYVGHVDRCSGGPCQTPAGHRQTTVHKPVAVDPSGLRHVQDTGHVAVRVRLHRHTIGDIFGVGSYVVQRSGSVSPLLIGRARLLGVHWVREEITATRLHNRPDAPYFWAPYDRVIGQERRAGLHVLGLLDYSNTWGYANHGVMPHRDMTRLSADFARYAYAVARHFRHKIRYWQVWNEPNLPMFWNPQPNPEDYADLLSVAYRAIKRANPRARVVLGGLSGVDLKYLNRVAARTHDFDVIAVHPYRNTPEDKLLGHIQALKVWHKPIWFSEMGWTGEDSCHLCWDEDTQERYLVRLYSLAAAAGVQRIFWYDLRDDIRRTSASPEAHFGLLRRDLSGKPAFAALAVLTRVLHGASFVHADSMGAGGLYVLRFSSPQGPIAVAWNVSDTDSEVTFPWTGSSAAAYGLTGEFQESLSVGGGRVAWHAPGGGMPAYILASAPPVFHVPGALLHPPPPPRPAPPKAHPAMQKPRPMKRPVRQRAGVRRRVGRARTAAVHAPRMVGPPKATTSGQARSGEHQVIVATPTPVPAQVAPGTATPVATPSPLREGAIATATPEMTETPTPMPSPTEASTTTTSQGVSSEGASPLEMTSPGTTAPIPSATP